MSRLMAAFLRLLTVVALIMGVQAAIACAGDQVSSSQVALVELHQPDGEGRPSQSDQALPHHHGACHSHQLNAPDETCAAGPHADRKVAMAFEDSDGLPLLPPGARLRPPIA